MGTIRRLRRLVSRSGESDDCPNEYECQSCGAAFVKQRQFCPDCGGYSIERRDWTSDGESGK